MRSSFGKAPALTARRSNVRLAVTVWPGHRHTGASKTRPERLICLLPLPSETKPYTPRTLPDLDGLFLGPMIRPHDTLRRRNCNAAYSRGGGVPPLIVNFFLLGWLPGLRMLRRVVGFVPVVEIVRLQRARAVRLRRRLILRCRLLILQLRERRGREKQDRENDDQLFHESSFGW